MSRPRIHEAKHPSPFFSFFLAENFIEAPPVEAIDVVSQLNAEEAAEAAEAADLSNLAAAAAASDTDESVGSSSADVRPLLPQGAANYLSRGLLNEDEALKLILQVSFFPPPFRLPAVFLCSQPFVTFVTSVDNIAGVVVCVDHAPHRVALSQRRRHPARQLRGRVGPQSKDQGQAQEGEAEGPGGRRRRRRRN